MKVSKIILLMLLCCVLLLSLVACTDSQTSPVTPERVMLDVDCGWEMQPNLGNIQPPFPISDNQTLKITDSLDDYSKVNTFTGISTPHTKDSSTLFNGNGIQLVRHYIGSPTLLNPPFVSELEDYEFLMDTINNLVFSKDHSERDDYDRRLIIYTFEKNDGRLNNTDQFYICADGTVLKRIEEDQGIVFYESLTPVDYYQISAMGIKYSQLTHYTYWFGQLGSNHTYKLCISGPMGHRDFTREEAEEILPTLLNLDNMGITEMTNIINHKLNYPLEDYIKISVYEARPSDESNPYEEQTFYLSPDGKLRQFRTGFAYFYYSGEREWFECNHILESVENFDYNAFLKLFDSENF